MHLIITGFSSFGNIKFNPTAKIIENIQTEFNILGVNLVECKVIKVSVAEVVKVIPYLHESILRHITDIHTTTDGGGGGRVIVHLGVDNDASVFSLECCAFNEANFVIPDEDGYMPQDEKVSAASPDVSLMCCIDVEFIANELVNRGFPCRVSSDPGRYVCNYLYFSSLLKGAVNEGYKVFLEGATRGV
eukprot:GHVR01133817.1.p1 GENE.GHVR01133817.1~~GHVR01133817.1.p1  ORF type:complete len:189 (+),score=30.36 GHVR01133817.1:788-1354(+)